MKKLVSLLLALVMILSLSAVVFAEETTYDDMETVTITKHYEKDGTTAVSPAETFNFTIERTAVSDAAADVTVNNMPLPTIGSVEYSAGDAGSANKDKEITINLPEYTSVGIYTYTIKETAGTTAGVTYYGNDIQLKVTVIEQNGKVRVAAVHTEAGFNGTKDNGKTDEITNTYTAGTLAVTKNVTGLLGDKQKEFKVTVTFYAPQGKTVNGTITYQEGTAPKTLTFTDNIAVAEITVKDGTTITFENIPDGVTYSVVEDSYSDYTTTYADLDGATKEEKADGCGTISGSENDTVTITNNKDGNVDTGVVLDSLPYILVLTIAVAGVAVLFVKKRHEA